MRPRPRVHEDGYLGFMDDLGERRAAGLDRLGDGLATIAAELLLRDVKISTIRTFPDFWHL